MKTKPYALIAKNYIRHETYDVLVKVDKYEADHYNVKVFKKMHYDIDTEVIKVAETGIFHSTTILMDYWRNADSLIEKANVQL